MHTTPCYPKVCPQTKFWIPMSIGPRRNKTCLRGFRQSDIQTNLLSRRDQLENWNFALASLDMILFIKRITKALIRLRICADWFAPLFLVYPRRQVFSRRRPYNIGFMLLHLMAELTCKEFEMSRYEGLCNYFVSSNGHQWNRLVSDLHKKKSLISPNVENKTVARQDLTKESKDPTYYN